MRYVKEDYDMMTNNLSQRSKGAQMMCLFAIQTLYVPLQQHSRLRISSSVQKQVKSRFFDFENRIIILLTFATNKK
jgi:hypothetical protein